MKNLDKQYLISIKSIFEFKIDYLSLSFFLKKLSDKQLAHQIYNEINLMNYGNLISLIDNYLFEKQQQAVLYEMTDIKLLNFGFITQITIQDLKDILDVSEISFYKVINKEGKETSLLRYWDNTNRIAIVSETQLFNEIKDNPELELNIREEILLANLGYYTKFTIEKYEEYQDNYENDIYQEFKNYGEYEGTYAQDIEGLSDNFINDVLDGEPDAYWNID